MDSKQLADLIITPVLKFLELYSKEAARLILFTSATESLCGHYLRQIGKSGYGPARGIYQCELNTFEDVTNFINTNNNLKTLIDYLKVPGMEDITNLTINPAFSTAICRVHYLRIKEGLPDYNDIDGIWNYYKKYYNSFLGKATKDKFIENINVTKAINISFEG